MSCIFEKEVETVGKIFGSKFCSKIDKFWEKLNKNEKFQGSKQFGSGVARNFRGGDFKKFCMKKFLWVGMFVFFLKNPSKLKN